MITIALIFGIALGAGWVATFLVFSLGYYIYEPNTLIANVEMGLSVAMTTVIILALVEWRKR